MGATLSSPSSEDNNQQAKPLTIEQLYTGTPESAQFDQDLQRSQHPRSRDMLLDMVTGLGLPPGSKVVDVGCGYASWSCQLAERCGAHVLAIDIVPSLLTVAVERIKAAGLQDRIEVREASIYQIPTASDSYDVVWCRDMLNHMHDPLAALQECYRVLQPGGSMLLFQVFAGELLEPREAERLYRALGIIPYNMVIEHVEHACTEAGFRIVRKDVVASEWQEADIEHGEHAVLDRLLLAARLLRHRQHFIDRYGEALYEQAVGDGQWLAFIMLGKLLPVAFLLRKGAA